MWFLPTLLWDWLGFNLSYTSLKSFPHIDSLFRGWIVTRSFASIEYLEHAFFCSCVNWALSISNWTEGILVCSKSEHWNVVIKALSAQRAFIHSREYVHRFVKRDHMMALVSVDAHFPAVSKRLFGLFVLGVSVKWLMRANVLYHKQEFKWP